MRCVAIFLFSVLSVVAGVSAAEKPAEEGYSDEERGHWSFQVTKRPKIPRFSQAADRAWIQTAVDAFVLVRLQQAGLQPAPRADRYTLIRRLCFDLTGLPPSPQAVHAFVSDRSPDAYAQLVDRLLASPHYGERWGQHWLDVVRFAETEGFEYDRHLPNAWNYRDYVIGSFNRDKPYDQFVTEQLAGDELASQVGGSSSNHREVRVAAGFHRLGPVRRNAGNTDVSFSRNETLTEMTDMIGSALLGLSLRCARCHDHMFDPIRQKDYYQFQAFLAATQPYDAPLASLQDQAEWQTRFDKVTKEIKQIKESLTASTAEAEPRLRKKLAEVERRLPAPLPALFTVKNDEEQRTPIHLLSRGLEDQKGERLGMRLLGVLVPDDTAELPAETNNPKTILAKWMTDPKHPLLARVMVNRIWQYHFGRGLVETANDFGNSGKPPSHPELLDFLANRFVANGWRIKALHRLILLSNTFRQSTRSPKLKVAAQQDPRNRLLWRFSRRRLDAEEIRDAMLAASGKLNPKAGGPSVIVPVDPELVKLLYKPAQWAVTVDRREHYRRSIYLIAKRNLRLPFMEVFDQPDLQTSCAQRVSTAHAPQSLELLNGKLSNELAAALADRLVREAGANRAQQVELAFVLTAGRPPSPTQNRLAMEFLRTEPLSEFALAMFNLNAFLYVD